MPVLDTKDHVDHQRWLIDHGFINDFHKNNLYMYGSLVHKNVEAVQVSIDIEKKVVEYQVYVSSAVIKKMEKFHKLSKSNGILDLWQLKRLLLKEGNLNFEGLLSRFVKDYLGSKWSITLQVKNIKDYEEGFEQNRENSSPADQSADGQ